MEQNLHTFKILSRCQKTGNCERAKELNLLKLCAHAPVEKNYLLCEVLEYIFNVIAV